MSATIAALPAMAVSSDAFARSIANKACIASGSIVDRANANSPLFGPGTRRAVHAGFEVRW
ncbi:MAG: hypothetical protein KDJ76_04965 [Xanthobacteraceae bacterium]|nr:hypothetical protein [Xanthobacteraceae bacterium]